MAPDMARRRSNEKRAIDDQEVQEDNKNNDDSESQKSQERQRRLSRLMYPSLSVFETSLLTASWIFILGYAWYLVYRVSRKYYRRFMNDGYLIETGLNSILPGDYYSDYTDHEWVVFSGNLLYTIPWIVFHLVGSQLLRKTNKSLVPIFNVLLTMIYMQRVMGTKPTIWMFCQPLAMFTIHLAGSSLLVWLCALVFLFIEKEWSGPLFHLNKYFLEGCTGTDEYVIYVTWYWVNSRCVSFCLDRIWKEVEPSSKGKLHDLIEMLAYCFYLPTNISGPIMIYKDFNEGFNKGYQEWTMKRLGQFLVQVVRYSFWLLIGHLLLHVFYQSSIRHEMDILRSLGLWTLAGVGLSIGGFFNLKYVIFYGWSRPFVVEDGIEKAPKHPKCIYRIHRYSEMWRHFDNGLYLFLRKYIHQPIVGKQGGGIRKIFGATITFTFIYLWHGLSKHVMLWSIFNYLAVMTEMLSISLGKNPRYIELEKRLFTPKGQRRFHAALGAPLFVGSVLANFYFFMGANVGHYFVERAFGSWPIETPLVLLFAYVGAQFSIEVKNWELRNEINLERQKHPRNE